MEQEKQNIENIFCTAQPLDNFHILSELERNECLYDEFLEFLVCSVL